MHISSMAETMSFFLARYEHQIHNTFSFLKEKTLFKSNNFPLIQMKVPKTINIMNNAISSLQ